MCQAPIQNVQYESDVESEQDFESDVANWSNDIMVREIPPRVTNIIRLKFLGVVIPDVNVHNDRYYTIIMLIKHQFNNLKNLRYDTEKYNMKVPIMIRDERFESEFITRHVIFFYNYRRDQVCDSDSDEEESEEEEEEEECDCCEQEEEEKEEE